MLRETALGPCKIISSMLRGPALGPCKTSGSMFGGYCWAHARPSVVCCGGSTGPIQKFIFSALNSIWAHSRHLQNICTLGPQWAHVGFHKHDGTFADGLSHYHRDFLVSLCASRPYPLIVSQFHLITTSWPSPASPLSST